MNKEILGSQNDEFIPNFFRIAYAYKKIIEDNMKKIRDVRKDLLVNQKIKLTNQQTIILLRLSLVKEISMTELASSLRIKLPNLHNQLEKLEKYIHKHSSTEDNRIQLIRLGETMKRYFINLPPTLDIKYITLLSEMKGEQRKIVANGMEEIIKHLKTELPEVIQAAFEFNP